MTEREAEMCQEAAAGLVALSQASYTYNSQNSMNNEKLADKLDGITKETKGMLDAMYICNVSFPSLHLDECLP
jgi:hypothetical protein